MQRSQSGFDIGLAKSVGSFFSNARQQATTGEEPNFYPSEKLTGHKFVDKLIKQ